MNVTENKNEATETTATATAAKKKLPLWGKILLVVVIVLAALAGLATLYVNGKLDLLHYNDGSVDSMGTIDADEDQDLDGSGLVHSDDEMTMPEGSPFADDDVLNILLIGTDERTEAVNDADAFTHLNQLDGTKDTTEFSEDARADSLILVSLDIKDHAIRLVSIERGLGVPILLDGYEGEYDWITHTFRYGGAKLTMDTVEDCFNVQVDHYVRINFNSFVQIVNAVGGVDIDITEMEAKALNWEVPSNSMLIVNHVDPGLNHFDGYTALQYARLRKIDNDWHRIERQRTVIQAVLDQIQNASVTELDNLLNTMLPLVQTNFTKTEIAALLVQLPGFLGCDVEQLSMPLQGTYGVRTGMDDRLMYDPDWYVNTTALQDFLYNDESAEEVIAATPETAAREAEGLADTATRETAVKASDPTADYLKSNLHTVDLSYPLDSSDFGNADYRLFLAGLEDTRAAEVQQNLITSLQSQGVSVVAVPYGPAAGALLESRLEKVPGAEKVYDFGTMSYADAKVGPQIEKRVRAKLGGEGDKPDPVRLALARAQAARRIVGTELAVACAERESDHVLVLSTKKGCWLRTVSAADNPGLWLLDMVRRAAAGLPQAEGTGFLPAGQTKQSDPPGRSQSKDPTPKKKHPLRVLLAVLVILALAAFGVAWYLTDGDLAALPQRLKTLRLPEWVTLWQAHEPKPGARLI